MSRLVMTAFAFALAASVTAAPDLSGTWTMSVTGGPHGPETMQLVLKQDGTAVSGTFASGHAADMEVTGKFENASLEIEAAGHGHGKIVMTARLKEDGTLAGVLSSEVGDMKWTASRAPGKNDKKRASPRLHGEGAKDWK